MRDHREHERVPMRTKIQYRADSSGEHFLLEETQNLSVGGIFIETREPVPLGSRLEVAFDLPGDGGRIVAAGAVVWVNEYRTEGPNPNPGMGIRFETMSDEYRAALQQVVKRIAIVPEIPGAPTA